MGKNLNLPAKSATCGARHATRLSFEGSGNDTKYIDIGLAMSVLNQKAYRSGLYYYVASIEVYNNEAGVMNFHTLPDTYATKNAWKYCFRKFNDMNRLASDVEEGKWADFRVYLDNNMRTTDSGYPLMPSLYTYNDTQRVLTMSESSIYSQFTTADDDGDSNQEADNFSIHMIGDHSGSAGNWTSVGAIKSYNTSRQQITTQGDPITHADADTDPLQNLFDMSSEEMINDIITNKDAFGDMPPYLVGTLQGEHDNSLYHVARIGTQVGLGRVGRASGFAVPLGLICVDPDNMSTDWRVVVNLVPGSYHGVHAERVM